MQLLGRKEQIALAEKYHFDDYAQPAGGCCFLTDKQYSDKLVDLWKSRHSRDYDFDDIMLLKIGRHLRIKPNYKLIISREEGENHFMQGYKKQFINLQPISCQGPLALIDGQLEKDDIYLASQVVARYSKDRHADEVVVRVNYPSGVSEEIKVKPLSAEEIQQQWHV